MLSRQRALAISLPYDLLYLLSHFLSAAAALSSPNFTISFTQCGPALCWETVLNHLSVFWHSVYECCGTVELHCLFAGCVIKLRGSVSEALCCCSTNVPAKVNLLLQQWTKRRVRKVSDLKPVCMEKSVQKDRYLQSAPWWAQLVLRTWMKSNWSSFKYLEP